MRPVATAPIRVGSVTSAVRGGLSSQTIHKSAPHKPKTASLVEDTSPLGELSSNRTAPMPFSAIVRTETVQILRSEGFVRSRRMQRFLTFVVEEALAGRA